MTVLVTFVLLVSFNKSWGDKSNCGQGALVSRLRCISMSLCFTPVIMLDMDMDSLCCANGFYFIFTIVFVFHRLWDALQLNLSQPSNQNNWTFQIENITNTHFSRSLNMKRKYFNKNVFHFTFEIMAGSAGTIRATF